MLMPGLLHELAHRAVSSSNISPSAGRVILLGAKAMAKIGPFPNTLADRCIIIRMHLKTRRQPHVQASSLRNAA